VSGITAQSLSAVAVALQIRYRRKHRVTSDDAQPPVLDTTIAPSELPLSAARSELPARTEVDLDGWKRMVEQDVKPLE
jgi:hypothetical protein